MGAADLGMENHSGHALNFDVFGLEHGYRSACFYQVISQLQCIRSVQRYHQRERYVKRFC